MKLGKNVAPVKDAVKEICLAVYTTGNGSAIQSYTQPVHIPETWRLFPYVEIFPAAPV
jgi:hypothetical protein